MIIPEAFCRPDAWASPIIYGIVGSQCDVSLHCFLILHQPNSQIMLQQLLSITQTAKRLGVRPAYVRELVEKGRLTFVHGEQLDAAAVERLARLMDKLRSKGLATLVQITADNIDDLER